MAVNVLPTKCDTYALNIAQLAIDMHNVAKDIVVNGKDISITTGIRCGEVVAGIVGQKLPRYCLFDNTVNLTSRCETTGLKGRINLTEYVYTILIENPNPSWHFECRGPVNMKGRKESMTCYILNESFQNSIKA